MKLIKQKLATAILLAGAMVTNAEAAIGTDVQFSSTGDANYNITGVASFDFFDGSTLIIRDDNATSSKAGITSVSGFFGTLGAAINPLAVGDTITYDIHYQSNLVGFSGGTPSPVPGFDIDGSANGSSGFEVTMVLSGRETAEVLAIIGSQVFIQFTSLTGTYEVYFDSTADSNNVAGTGFKDDTLIISGTIGLAPGSTNIFGANATGFTGTGSTFLKNTINFYDPNYIQADPSTNAPLVGTTFETTINLDFEQNSPLGVSGKIGVDQYARQNLDLALRADAKVAFQANPRQVPEPTTIMLMGAGLLMAGLRRRQNSLAA